MGTRRVASQAPSEPAAVAEVTTPSGRPQRPTALDKARKLDPLAAVRGHARALVAAYGAARASAIARVNSSVSRDPGYWQRVLRCVAELGGEPAGRDALVAGR